MRKIILFLFAFAFALLNMAAIAQDLTPTYKLFLQKDFKKVCAFVDSLQTGSGFNQEALMLKVQALKKMQQPRKAGQCLAQAIADSLGDASLYTELGDILYGVDLIDSAQQMYSYVYYNIDSTDMDNATGLGRCYDKNKIWSMSLALYSSLVKLDSTNTYLLFRLSNALTEEKHGDWAIPYLLTLLNLEPDHKSARYLLQRIYFAMDKREEAFAHIDTLKMLEPNNQKWYMTAGYAHYLKLHYFSALPEFKKALTLRGIDSEEAFHMVGNCLFATKKYREALPYLKSGEEMTGTAESFYKIATSYLNLNVLDSAQMYYNKSYQYYMPSAFNLQQVLGGMAEVYVKQQRYAETVDCYKKLIENIKGLQNRNFVEVDCLRKIGEIYDLHLRDSRKAIEYYTQYLTSENHYSPKQDEYYRRRIEKLKEELFFEGKQ